MRAMLKTAMSVAANARRPRVYITQDNGKLDFTTAKRFGELVPMVQRDIFPDNAEERAAKIQHIIAAKLTHFLPGEDHLLLVGDPAVCAIAMAFLARRHESVRLLKWDREGSAYYEIPVHFNLWV